MVIDKPRWDTPNLPCRMVSSKGFYRWAWGIVEGCCNECDYCYANNNKKFHELRFREDLLYEPMKVLPSFIFVNHLGDIMCYPPDQIRMIIDVCEQCPDHTFLFMSKLPYLYNSFVFPDNCIIGVTIESPDKWHRALTISNFPRTMASIEPIMGDFTGYDFSQFEFVVVGCLIGQNDHKYYDTVKHHKIYYTR